MFHYRIVTEEGVREGVVSDPTKIEASIMEVMLTPLVQAAIIAKYGTMQTRDAELTQRRNIVNALNQAQIDTATDYAIPGGATTPQAFAYIIARLNEQRVRENRLYRLLEKEYKEYNES